MQTKLPLILANKADQLPPLRLLAGAGSVQMIEAEAATEGQPARLPRFRMQVYNGGIMAVSYYGRVVLDLAGGRVPDRAVPVHRDHDTGQIVGHGVGSIGKSAVTLDGEISGTGPAAVEVVGNAKNGFPWQASIEAQPLRFEEVRQGVTVKVNGRSLAGPFTLLRDWELKGASFVSLGADPTTRVRVAASRREKGMTFHEWVKAKGFDPNALTEDQQKTLQAAYDAEQAASDKDTAGGNGRGTDPAAVPAPAVDAAAIAANAIKAERERQGAIEAACKGEWSDEAGKKIGEIRAIALSSDESPDSVRAKVLDVLRASRPQRSAPAFIEGGSTALNARLLVAALCIANRLGDDAKLVAEFGEQTMNAADKFRSVRLTEVIEAAASLDGVNLPRFGRGSHPWIQAAFSSLSLSGILGAVANKSLLAAYQAVRPGIRVIFKRGTVSNFQTHTRYRLTADGTFQKMAPSGELQHGSMGQQTYTQKADTYGRYFQLTRQDVVNDDLGAFLQIPELLGRGWALAIEEAGVTLLLSNPSSFFSSSPSGYNANYASGAGSALGVAGLDAAVALFDGQVDSNGKPISAMARYLVVPPALRSLAERLYKGQNLESVASGLSSTSSRAVEQLSNNNNHAGKYEPVVIPQLAASAFTGYSATAWYLWADPAQFAAFEVAYLNGQDMPTIESVGVASDVLGLGFRGYGDFGVAAVDPRAAVKSAGV